LKTNSFFHLIDVQFRLDLFIHQKFKKFQVKKDASAHK